MLREVVELHMFKLEGLTASDRIIDLAPMIIVASALEPAKMEAMTRIAALAPRHPGLCGIRVFDAEGEPHDVYLPVSHQARAALCSHPR